MCFVSKQWFQIVAVWVAVAVLGLVATLNFTGETRYAIYAALAAAAIATVSIEHLVSASAKDTVRQQIYVASGSFAVLGLMTLWTLLS